MFITVSGPRRVESAPFRGDYRVLLALPLSNVSGRMAGMKGQRVAYSSLWEEAASSPAMLAQQKRILENLKAQVSST